MYSSFHVQNFRGFNDLQLNDLGRINLIAGKNNVGKTSVLLAIWFLSGYHEAVLREILFSLKSQNQVDEPYKFDILFHDHNTDDRITFEGRLSHLEQYYLEFKIDKPEEDFQQVRIVSAGGDEHMVVLANQQLGNVRPLSVLINSLFLKAHQISSFKEDRKRFNGLMINKQTDLLVESLRAVEPRIKDIQLLDNGFYANIEQVRKLLPLTTMGEGVNRLASIILAMSQVQNGVLLIDEIENGLHYSVQEKVWQAIGEVARQFNVQIFATTHSLEMIRAGQAAFKDDNVDDFRLYRLERNPASGEIEAVTINEDMLASAVEFGFEVR